MDGVRVAVRVRPLNAREIAAAGASPVSWHLSEGAITQCIADRPVPPNDFAFDNVYVPGDANDHVYLGVARPVVASAVEGVNGVVFAYGQTAAGKTYTMLGTDVDPGLTRRSISEVFERIAACTGRQFLLRASYIEIYNENIRDLLAPECENLKIHEDVVNKRVFVDSREEVVSSVAEVMAIISAGEDARAVGVTNMNERSSRSHTIFTLKIESREMAAAESEDTADGDGVAVCASTLSLVDLAGSERASFTKAEGVRLKEGGHINKSLLTLGTVINKLSSGEVSSVAHIPYRDSKLTRILQPALGGNARTAIICAVTPSVLHMEETLSTLKFASRAKKVTNHAKRNEYLDDRAKLRRAEKELQNLKRELQRIKGRVSSSNAPRGAVSAVDTCESAETLREEQDNKRAIVVTEKRIKSFAKKFEELCRVTGTPEKVNDWSVSEATITLSTHESTLREALDLSYPPSLSARRSGRTASDPTVSAEAEEELTRMRQRMLVVESERRRAFAEISYERQAMTFEVDSLVAAAGEQERVLRAAEDECEQAVSALARAQAASIVDEMMSQAMVVAESSRELRYAQGQLLEMDSLRVQAADTCGQLSTLRKELTDALKREKRGVGPVLKEVNILRSKLSEAESKMKSMRQGASRLTSEKAALEKDIKDKERRLKVLDGELERHRKHSAMGQTRISKEIAEEKKKFDALLKEEHSARSSLESALADKAAALSELQSRVQAAEELVSAKDAESLKLRNNFAEESKRVEELATQLSSTEIQLKKMGDALHVARTEHGLVTEENDKRSEELADAHMLLEERKVEVAKLQALLNEAIAAEEQCGQQLTESASRVAELETLVSASRKSHEDEHRKALEERSRAERATSAIEEHMSKNAMLVAQQEKDNELRSKLSQQVRGLEEKLRDSCEALQTETESASSLRERARCLEESNKEKTETVHALKTELEALEAVASGANSTLEVERARSASLEERIAVLADKVNILDSRECGSCVTLRGEVALLRAQEKEVGEGLKAQTDVVKLAGERMQEQVNAIREENAALLARTEKLLVETTLAEKSRLKVVESLNARETRVRNLEDQLAAYRRGDGAISKLEKRLARRDRVIEDHEQLLATQDELLAQGGLSAERLNAQRLCEIEQENSALKTDVSRRDQSIADLERDKAALSEESRKLRDRIKQRDVQLMKVSIRKKEAEADSLQALRERRQNV